MKIIEKDKELISDDIINEIHELQNIELNILLDVDKFCRDHKIKYFLGEGTLLGAVRHNGFIPWDDDVDIIMLREDYEYFLSMAPTLLSPKYEVQHSTTVDNYWSPFIKIRLLDENQKYRQQHIAHLTSHNGAYIDVFPLEFVPEEMSLKCRLQSTKIRFFRGMLSLKLGLRKPKNLKQYIMKMIGFIYSVKTIHIKLDNEFNRYNSGAKNYVANLASYHKLESQIVPAEIYKESVDCDFEGNKLPIPKNYDYLLKKIYGDYMKLPPVNERYTKHHFNEID